VTVILVFYRFLFILVFTVLVSGATLGGMAYGAFNYEKASIPPEVIVPDVIAKPAETARSLFEDDLGLHFRITLKQGHPTIPAGAVITTTPEPGRRVRQGRTIEAVVSTGAELVTMPRLVNSQLDEVATTLERLGLKVGYTQKSVSDSVPEGAVISQDIGPGRKVAPGTKVSLKVSTGPREAAGSSERKPADDEATDDQPETDQQVKVKKVGRVRITVPAQANLTTVKVVIKDDNGERTVYNELHYAGDVVQTDVEGTGETVVEVYLNGQRVETKVL
jgi:serine/threonine-protein kinase